MLASVETKKNQLIKTTAAEGVASQNDAWAHIFTETPGRHQIKFNVVTWKRHHYIKFNMLQLTQAG